MGKGVRCFILAICAIIFYCPVEAQTITLPKGSQNICLVDSASAVPGVPYWYRDLGNGEAAMVMHNIAFTMNDKGLSAAYVMPWDRQITDVKWYDGSCFFAADSTLAYITPEGVVRQLVIADRRVTSFDVYERGVVFSVDSLLCFYSFLSLQPEPVFHADTVIRHIECIGEDVLFCVGASLFAIGGGSLHEIYSSSHELLSFVPHPSGAVFIGTDESVFYLDPARNKVTLIDKPTLDMSMVEDDLYIVFTDYSSVKVTNVSEFFWSLNQ